LVTVLKVTDEKNRSRIRIQIKLSRIRNTGFQYGIEKFSQKYLLFRGIDKRRGEAEVEQWLAALTRQEWFELL
jgi:hypothetical protein